MSQVPKILLVSSCNECSRRYHEMLRSYPWTEVETIHAKDGQEAIRVLSENPETELVLFDMNTLAGGALDFLQGIRLSPSLGITPVILLTGGDRPAEISKGIDAGAFTCLTNPITRERLHMHLDVILGR